MQALANAWFDRRRTGTHAAREAVERMCGAKTYFDLVQEYQAWATGEFERIMADQQQIMAATTSALGSPPLTPSASEKEPEQLARPARSKTAAM